MRSIQIGRQAVGRGERTFVIAEIGVNHDGSLQRAIELTDIAAACGADAIKLQLFRARQLMHHTSSFAEYQRQRVAAADPADMLRQYELNDLDVVSIAGHAAALGLKLLATPFSLSDVDTIAAFDLPAIKIASPDIVNLPLLRRSMRLLKPMLISTGAATIGEVRRCVEWAHGQPIALMHCVSAYPVSAVDANLGWIGELSRRFDRPIGYSDHTTDVRCGAMAVLAGACIVEKHLTYDCTATGPDHSASADPATFRQYVAAIREAEQWNGVGGKRVLPVEEDVRRVSRQSLVLNRDVVAGERLKSEMFITQRPGTGISAADIDLLINSTIKTDLPAGTMIAWDMLIESQRRAA